MCIITVKNLITVIIGNKLRLVLDYTFLGKNLSQFAHLAC